MPYIKPNRREELSLDINTLAKEINFDVGELNYVVTQLCRKYLDRTPKKYTDYNSIVGVLECAKLEFYRRAAANYEDAKIKENGDVY
jgi:broad-specificity NMP kinase